MKKNQIKNSAELFFYKANSDLNAAKYLLEAMEDDKVEIDIEIIMFHLQQCAEKLLKSILSLNKVRIQKTHDISELIEISVKNNIPLMEEINQLEDLSDFAVEGGYGIIYDDIDNVRDYIEILEKFLNYVKNLLKGE